MGAKRASRKRNNVQPFNSNVVEINTYQKKKPVTILPRNRNQESYVLKLLDETKDIVFGIGPAGTGKTLLAVQVAVKLFKEGAIDKIIVTRPAVSVDENLGFLPGTLEDKMAPWTRPIFDVLREYFNSREIEGMIEEGIIEIAPLAYMRGRTFKNSFILADEMQNATPNQMKMLLTRLGQGSQMAVTGVQAKVSLSIHRKEELNEVKKLTIVGLYGDYILKPPSEHYEQLPELEHLTMKLAHLCGLKTVPHSLVRLKDKTLCYITKRVDRHQKGKFHMEDMCQLTERLTEDKYKGSHEQVAKTILKYSSNPMLDVSNFYELVLFCFFTGNADMHLKNFSLLGDLLGNYTLSPAYDLLNTALVIKSDKEELALTLNGKKSKLKYNDFLVAYETSGLSKKVLDNYVRYTYSLQSNNNMYT
jgi:serine/threonine-protein kinase HipA